MFDIVLTLLGQFCECLPFFISIYILFDFIGTLLFGRSQFMNSKLYVPNYDNYACIIVYNSNTIRAYKQYPLANNYADYDDFFINSHYISNSGTQHWYQTSTLPECISPENLTDDFYYRNDLADILIIFLIFLIVGFRFPWKILCRMFRRWN